MPAKRVARRDVLQTLGAGLAWVPLAHLVGCGDNASGGQPTSGDAGTDRGPLASGSDGSIAADTGSHVDAGADLPASGDGGSGSASSGQSSPGGASGDAAANTDAVADTDAAADVAGSSDGGGWATGGTASMTGKASYPNPFAGGSTSGCVATGTLTQGPCYDSASVKIQDISYGQNGLPMRMYFQALDSACNPIAGATVDVWHVAPTGKYSGNDSVNEIVSYCTGNDADYTSHLYFRGRQVTDSTGVVFFDTCFPGWYSGRTIHVHFIITAGSKSLTSQYLFDDALDDQIIGTQPIYGTRGKRDTTNTTDAFVSASQYQKFLFQTKRMSDGTMLAWKGIVLS
jgi:protocatechuate 3,4-dioxygenase beta subunit